ncbi:MAG: polysaccharide deacetylase family protein [Pseudomonadota bacterium]
MSGRDWQVPVLTYHASTVGGPAYAGNDHVAFGSDLATATRLGWRIVPLQWVVEQRLGLADRDLTRCLALSCDDGTVLDVRDVDYPGQGRQRSFLGLLEAQAAQPDAHLTCFVIASPDARARMDRDCLHGLGWMGEDWWAPALAGGRIGIGNHSWDHNHPVMAEAGPGGMPRGDFFVVDSDQRAAYEIRQAADYLAARLGPGACPLFAYPYGHAPDFLVHEWFPRHGAGLGLQAAFGTQGGAVGPGSDPWNLPRYVCGLHWSSPEQFEALLAGLA